MFAGRGQQSLVLTLTPDFRKVRHILFGSEYGAKVNIFKWINYPLLWVESRILILFWQLLCKFAGENYKCIFDKKNTQWTPCQVLGLSLN